MGTKELFIFKRKMKWGILIIVVILSFLIYMSNTMIDPPGRIFSICLLIIYSSLLGVLFRLHTAKWPEDFNGRRAIMAKCRTTIIAEPGDKEIAIKKGTLCYLDHTTNTNMIRIVTEDGITGWADKTKFIK